MAYGSGVYGEGLYGGAPDPEKFEEQSEQEKNEDYRELYNKLEEVDEELKKQKMILKGGVEIRGSGGPVAS